MPGPKSSCWCGWNSSCQGPVCYGSQNGDSQVFHLRFGLVGPERGWRKNNQPRCSILRDANQRWRLHIPLHQALKMHLGVRAPLGPNNIPISYWAFGVPPLMEDRERSMLELIACFGDLASSMSLFLDFFWVFWATALASWKEKLSRKQQYITYGYL